jgi:hypothetical protein
MADLISSRNSPKGWAVGQSCRQPCDQPLFSLRRPARGEARRHRAREGRGAEIDGIRLGGISVEDHCRASAGPATGCAADRCTVNRSDQVRGGVVIPKTPVFAHPKLAAGEVHPAPSQCALARARRDNPHSPLGSGFFVDLDADLFTGRRGLED